MHAAVADLVLSRRLPSARRVAAQEKENDEWKDLQELMETPGKNRLSILLDNVRDFDAEMYDDCHNRPSRVIPAYEKAMNDMVRARKHARSLHAPPFCCRTTAGPFCLLTPIVLLWNTD